MKKYTFTLLHSTIIGFKEIDHIILASSLTDAIEKFTRKHNLEAPAYWDEPSFDTFIEMIFSIRDEKITYQISW
ncbi:hypothetical protein [Caldalkalibacillus mannanilyticus]|uniref:hypothetical protein n=1 Tax=Caldalkalibacillus mannanilyticus TaxID=1418 RepID=UPI0004694A72|nr:hypothetical protein [Caldalkalibacillus mannanilyticus]